MFSAAQCLRTGRRRLLGVRPRGIRSSLRGTEHGEMSFERARVEHCRRARRRGLGTAVPLRPNLWSSPVARWLA